MKASVSSAQAAIILSACLIVGMMIGLLPHNSSSSSSSGSSSAWKLRSTSDHPQQHQQQQPSTGGFAASLPKFSAADVSPFSPSAWPEERNLEEVKNYDPRGGGFGFIQDWMADNEVDLSMGPSSFSFEFDDEEGSFSFDFDYTPAPLTTTPSPIYSAPSTPAPAPLTPETPAPTLRIPELTAEPTAAPAAGTVMPVAPPTAECRAVIIEAEDLGVFDDAGVFGSWTVKDDADASGGKYIVWEGLSAGENNRDAAYGDIISTTFEITTAGTYRFKWLMRQPSGVASNKGNDSWLYIPGATRFGPKDSEDSYDGFIKVFGNTADGDFEYKGTAGVDGDKTAVVAVFAQAGTYEMKIAGRSHGHEIDQIILYPDDLKARDAAADCQ